MNTNHARVILSTAEEIQNLVDDLMSSVITAVSESNGSNGYWSRGTILKASEFNGRFKDKSAWVSLGDGKYQHITGKKGLVAKHSRLNGYVKVIFQP